LVQAASASRFPASAEFGGQKVIQNKPDERKQEQNEQPCRRVRGPAKFEKQYRGRLKDEDKQQDAKSKHDHRLPSPSLNNLGMKERFQE
jgi:hypothetical protein